MCDILCIPVLKKPLFAYNKIGHKMNLKKKKKYIRGMSRGFGLKVILEKDSNNQISNLQQGRKF
jgi:hypothetical protein